MFKVTEGKNSRIPTTIDAAREHGWALLKNYFSAKEADAVTSDIRRLIQSPSNYEPCMFFYGTDANEDRRLTRIERLWEALPSLRATGLGARIVKDASTFLDGDAVLFKDKVNIRYAKSSGYAPHQDSAAGWEEFADRFVSFGLFLHPSDPFRGGFEVASNAHKVGRFSNSSGKMTEDDFLKLNPLQLTAQRGDVIVLDSEAPHKTLDNQSEEDSFHLLFTFARAMPGAAIRNAYYDKKEDSFSSSKKGNEYEFRMFKF